MPAIMSDIKFRCGAECGGCNCQTRPPCRHCTDHSYDPDKALIAVKNPIGTRVILLLSYGEIQKDTQGVVDAVYQLDGEPGFMVAWDLPERPLPAGYRAYDGSLIVRDGFVGEESLMLEVIE